MSKLELKLRVRPLQERPGRLLNNIGNDSSRRYCGPGPLPDSLKHPIDCGLNETLLLLSDEDSAAAQQKPCGHIGGEGGGAPHMGPGQGELRLLRFL